MDYQTYGSWMSDFSVRQVPVVPGWITSYDPGKDVLTAVRVGELTRYQEEYGCRTQVTATDARELECLCIAEIVHAAMVSKAEAAPFDGP